MSVFKDTNGREWRIRLTGPKLTKVRESTDIKLAAPSGEGAVMATEDGEILTRILWLLCGDQEPKIASDLFGEAMASGEVFEAAREALKEAVVDFTPPSQRPMLQKVLEADKREQAARTKVVMEKLNGDALHDRACQSFRVGLDKQLTKILTRLENAGALEDSPTLTPTSPPSES